MEKDFSDTHIQYCQEEFDLTYHVPFAFNCAQQVGFKDKHVLEVGGSLPPAFVFEHLEAGSWTACETPLYDAALKESGGITHQGTVIGSAIVAQQGFGEPLAQRYSFFLANIEELPAEHEQTYDLIFSIAAFEHILKFPIAIDKMYRALKPGGQLFSLFAPVWSSYNGHHIPDITDADGNVFSFMNNTIPPWGHLLLSSSEMFRHLLKSTDYATASLITYYIYHAPSINRLFCEDYAGFILQTPFIMETFNAMFNIDVPEEIFGHLQRMYPSRINFGNNGIRVILKKPE